MTCMHSTKTVSVQKFYRIIFAETNNCFGKHVEIYTDGSKTGESVACAMICGNQIEHASARQI